MHEKTLEELAGKNLVLLCQNSRKQSQPRALGDRFDSSEEVGGARRDRTADLLHAMQALSQLSYSPATVAGYFPCSAGGCQFAIG